MEDKNTSVQPGENGGGAPENKPAEATQPPVTPSEPTEIKVPKRNADYWDKQQERQKAKQSRAEFFKSKQQPPEEDSQEDDDDKPLTRREYRQLQEENNRHFEEESAKRSMAQSDALAITEYLAKPGNDRFRKYEAQARAYAKEHPYYPISGIFRDLAYDDAQAEGAERGAKEQEKAKRNSSGGSGRRVEPEATGYNAKSSKEHSDFKRGLRSGKVSFGA